jgi:hypothetical protein
MLLGNSRAKISKRIVAIRGQIAIDRVPANAPAFAAPHRGTRKTVTVIIGRRFRSLESDRSILRAKIYRD